MSKQKLKMFIPVLCVSFVGLVTVVSIKHASTHYSESPNASNGVQLTQRSRGRNLSLRPGAFNMARRLGTRFLPENPQRSLIAGTIRTGSENRVFQMVREQTGDGEQVEIGLDQSAAVLRWDARDGATSFGSRASGRDRDLIEKLVFDKCRLFCTGAASWSGLLNGCSQCPYRETRKRIREFGLRHCAHRRS